jgi:hypothetical protein
MKKILSLILAMAMVSTSTFASTADINTSHPQMIAKTFNEFNYNMTVNAGESNADYQSKAVEEFKQRLVDLQAKGVTPDEIMSYMRSTILDASARKDFDSLLSSMDNSKVSSEEAGNMAMQFMAKKYQAGASYSGGTASYKGLIIVAGIIIVGVVTYFVWKNMQNTSTTTDTSTQTKTDTVTDTVTCTYTVTDTCTYTNTITAQ